MPLEGDAEHLGSLSLVPSGSGEDTCHRREARFALGQAGREMDDASIGDVAQATQNLVPLVHGVRRRIPDRHLVRPVDGGQVREEHEAQFIACGGDGVHPIRGGDEHLDRSEVRGVAESPHGGRHLGGVVSQPIRCRCVFGLCVRRARRHATSTSLACLRSGSSPGAARCPP